MPKVSIIVPVYNTEKYLHKCLDSLVGQTLEAIEIVIVNDGSKDSSPEIIKEYMDKYPGKFVYSSQENAGQAVARNRAIKMCTGEYIGFLDSDDTAECDMFEKMLKKAEESLSDMVVCDYYYVTDKYRVYKHVKDFKSQKDMFVDCFVDPWNKLYRACVLKDNDIVFPEGYFYEDTGWFIKTIPYVKKFSKIDEALVCHYKREGSTMTALDDSRVQHIFPVMEDIIHYYKKLNIISDYRDELEYFCSRILLCSSVGRISRVIDKKTRKELVDRSFDFLNKCFPTYKSNKYYQHTMRGIYIKCLNKYTIGGVLLVYRVNNFIKDWRG